MVGQSLFLRSQGGCTLDLHRVVVGFGAFVGPVLFVCNVGRGGRGDAECPEAG